MQAEQPTAQQRGKQICQGKLTLSSRVRYDVGCMSDTGISCTPHVYHDITSAQSWCDKPETVLRCTYWSPGSWNLIRSSFLIIPSINVFIPDCYVHINTMHFYFAGLFTCFSLICLAKMPSNSSGKVLPAIQRLTGGFLIFFIILLGQRSTRSHSITTKKCKVTCGDVTTTTTTSTFISQRESVLLSQSNERKLSRPKLKGLAGPYVLNPH